jgi:hypothetical protein
MLCLLLMQSQCQEVKENNIRFLLILLGYLSVYLL